MNTFERRYQVARDVWSDCYLGYLFVAHNDDAPTKQTLVAQLSGTQIPLPISDAVELSALDSSLHELTADDGKERISQLLTEAMHFASNEKIPDGEAGALAEAFIATFVDPVVFANSLPHSASWHPVTSHTFDTIVCCVDAVLIGCLLTVGDE